MNLAGMPLQSSEVRGSILGRTSAGDLRGGVFEVALPDVSLPVRSSESQALSRASISAALLGSLSFRCLKNSASINLPPIHHLHDVEDILGGPRPPGQRPEAVSR